MDLSQLTRTGDFEWQIAPHGAMRVPALIYADEQLVADMDEKVYEQVCNVAMLPGNETADDGHGLRDGRLGHRVDGDLHRAAALSVCRHVAQHHHERNESCGSSDRIP